MQSMQRMQFAMKWRQSKMALKRWLALLQSDKLARLRGWRVKRGGHELKLGMRLLRRVT